MILYEFVQKPMNSYVSICIQIETYELGCTNCVVRIRIIKKNEIKLSRDSNPCTNNIQTYVLPASSTAYRTAIVFYNI